MPIPAASWRAWSRPLMTFQRSTYVSHADPLFVHQVLARVGGFPRAAGAGAAAASTGSRTP